MRRRERKTEAAQLATGIKERWSLEETIQGTSASSVFNILCLCFTNSVCRFAQQNELIYTNQIFVYYNKSENDVKLFR